MGELLFERQLCWRKPWGEVRPPSVACRPRSRGLLGVPHSEEGVAGAMGGNVTVERKLVMKKKRR